MLTFVEVADAAAIYRDDWDVVIVLFVNVVNLLFDNKY